MIKVFVAIPCYNCARHIEKVLEGFTASLVNKIHKVVVIDNCSTDATVNIAKKKILQLNNSKFEIRRNKKNYGLGGTFKLAFELARAEECDFLVFLHGDGQAPTFEVEKLLKHIEEDPTYSAYLGSRFMLSSQLKNYAFQRLIGNLGFNLLFSLLTQKVITDIGSGLTAYSVSKVSNEDLRDLPQSITFDADLLLKLISKRQSFKFIPIEWVTEGQISTVRDFEVGLEVLKTLVNWRLGRQNKNTNSEVMYSEKV